MSAWAMSSRNSSRPRSARRSSVTAFLLRACTVQKKWRPSRSACPQVRSGSGLPGSSILMTSAPMSPSSRPANGPEISVPSSMTRMSWSAPVGVSIAPLLLITPLALRSASSPAVLIAPLLLITPLALRSASSAAVLIAPLLLITPLALRSASSPARSYRRAYEVTLGQPVGDDADRLPKGVALVRADVIVVGAGDLVHLLVRVPDRLEEPAGVARGAGVVGHVADHQGGHGDVGAAVHAVTVGVVVAPL